jgi:gas vesicle protein
MSGPADGRSTSSFLRGLTIGAILGAIVAGSSLWSRWRRGRRTGD